MSQSQQKQQQQKQDSQQQEQTKQMEDPFSDPKQLAHFKRIVASFLNYTVDSMQQIARIQRDFNHSKTKRPDLQYLFKYNPDDKINKLKQCVKVNQQFLDQIVHDHLHLFQFHKSSDGKQLLEQLHVSYKEVLRMRSTVKQFARQWSEEGKPQREQCYGKILNELENYFPSPKIQVVDAVDANGQNNNKQHRLVKVLHPGSGLGRLPYECAKRGYASQGNQYTYLMLLGSNFLLNCIQHQKQFSFYPYIHNFSNNRKYDDPFRQVKIPDECPPFELPKDGDFSMVAGDFLLVYKDQKEEWDCLITCFFIDTANNILQYIDLIHQTLRNGGVWINFGPLLYHFTDLQDECSIELSWEEVRFAIQKVGFQIKRESFEYCNYSAQLDSLMKTTYNSIFFTAIKK